MSISLESGNCVNCDQENSVHLNNCHNCGVTLPWAGSEATKLLTEATTPEEEKLSLRKMVIVYGIATAIVTTGVFLWIGNVSGLFPTLPRAGFLTVVAGGLFFKWGDKILMGID